MPDTIRYHRGASHQYRLEFITDDEEEAREYAQSRNQDEEIIDATPLPTRLEDGRVRYPVYVIKMVSEKFVGDDIGDDIGEIEEWIQTHFTEDERQVLAVVLESINEIIEEKRTAEEEFEFYKRADLRKIPDVLDGVEWGGENTVSEVGGNLLSTFILAHPLPNANHRTALTVLDRYLTSIDRGFEMPDTGETGEWYPWVRDYIHESKRLTTLRRKAPIFRYVQKNGFDVVERKHGVQIDLTVYDINRSDAFGYFTDQHQEYSEQFVRTLLNEVGLPELAGAPGMGEQAFYDELAGSEERD